MVAGAWGRRRRVGFDRLSLSGVGDMGQASWHIHPQLSLNDRSHPTLPLIRQDPDHVAYFPIGSGCGRGVWPPLMAHLIASSVMVRTRGSSHDASVWPSPV